MSKKLALEDRNFHVNSDGWKKIMVDGKEYLENPENDIWEIIGGEDSGEQLFTWDAAMRETAKAGRRMPTNANFAKFKINVKTKSDIPNLVLSGIHNTNGAFHYQGTAAYFWTSSAVGTDAWVRHLDLSLNTVFRGTLSKTHGFSVRCLKRK